MTHNLSPNQVIAPCVAQKTACFECPQRVLWVDTSTDTVVLIGIEPDVKQPRTISLETVMTWLDSGECEIVEMRARPLALTGHDAIPQRYLDIRDRAWALIEPLVDPRNVPAIFEAGLRGQLISQRAAELNLNTKQIRRPLYRYWTHGSIKAALVPFYDMCGPQGAREQRLQKKGTAKRGRRPDRLLTTGDKGYLGPAMPDVREKLIAGITEFYKEGVSKRKAWRDTKTKYFNTGFVQHGNLTVPVEPAPHEAPSLRQFSRVIDELDVDLSLTKKIVDSSTWNLGLRSVLGSSRQHVFGPCARFEIDATIMDIYLVSVFNPAWIIGRPVLYVVVDVFSGMVVGFYLGLEGPSWEGARLALFNAFTDKVNFCRQFGVDITPEQWPCHHLPRYLLGDNGELCGLAADDLPGTLGIWPQNAAVQRGDWKPNVEQQFRLINLDQVHFLPGAVNARKREMRKRKYVLDACLTLPELTSIMIRRFIRFNQSNYNKGRLPEGMLGDNLTDATPLSVWNWGLANMTGATNVRSRHEVWTNLLPRATATIRPTGLFFEQRHYSNARIEREEWFARARKEGRYGHVEIRHLPYAPGTIWVRNDERGEWESCHLLDRDEQYRLARIEEVWDRFKLLNAAAQDKADEVRMDNAKFDAECEAIVAQAQRKAKDARQGMTKVAITRNIDANRAFEKAAGRVDRAREEIESHRPSSAVPARPTNVIPMTKRRTGTDPLDDVWEVEA
jgi:putative transposase